MTTTTTSLQSPIVEVFPFALVETTDVEGKPMAGFVHRGIVIHDPTVTECGRFTAKSDLYGMTDAQVLALVRLNAQIEEAADAAISAGTNVIQKHLDIVTGDQAKTFFAGENKAHIERLFLRYALTEVAKGQVA